MKSKLLNGFVGLMVLGVTPVFAQFDDLYSDPIKKVQVKKEVVNNTFAYGGNEYDNDYYDADQNDYYNEGDRSPAYYDDLDFNYSRRINTFRRNAFTFGNPYRFASMYDPMGYSFYDPFFDPFWGNNMTVVNVGIGGGFGWNRWNSWNNMGWNNMGWNNMGWNNMGWNSWGNNMGWNSWGNNRGWNSWGWNACPPSWNRPVFVNNYYNNVGSTVNNNPNNVNGLNKYYGSRTNSSTTTSTAGRVDGPRSYRGTTPTDQNLTSRSVGTENTSGRRATSSETSASRPSIYSRGSDNNASSSNNARNSGRSATSSETQRSVYSRSSDNYSGSRTTTSSARNSSSSPSRSASSSDYGRSSSNSSSTMGSSRSSSSSGSSAGSSSGSSGGGGGRSSGRGG